MPVPTFRPLQSNDTTDPRRLELYLRELERQVISLSEQLNAANANTSAPPTVTPQTLVMIKRELQAGGSAELDLTNLTGVIADSVDVRIPRVTSAPDPVTAPYDTYVLVGSPDTLWQIDRTTNPPVAVQVSFVPSGTFMTLDTSQTVTASGDKVIQAPWEFQDLLTLSRADQVILITGAAAVSTKMIEINPGASVFSVDIEGDVIANLGTFAGLLNATLGFTVSNALANINGGLALAPVTVSSNVTLDPAEILASVNTNAARAISLPPSPSSGQIHCIKDSTGTGAGTNNITVSGNGNNIDGAASHVITTNRAGFIYWYDGSQWIIAASF